MKNDEMQYLSDEEIAQLKGGTDVENINKAAYCSCDNKPASVSQNKNITVGCECKCDYLKPPRVIIDNALAALLGSCN